MTDSYDISESTIRRILKKTKYTLEEDFEESTSQSASVTLDDDNNQSGQSTVTISQSGKEGYEPAEEVNHQHI
jgi:hypothetical protein